MTHYFLNATIDKAIRYQLCWCAHRHRRCDELLRAYCACKLEINKMYNGAVRAQELSIDTNFRKLIYQRN